MHRAVFLDRDGTINELIYYNEMGIIDSPFTVEQFKLLPGVNEGIKLLNHLGLKVVVVSNQPGVARNYFTLEMLASIDSKMSEELSKTGAFIDAVYYCPHSPNGKNPEYSIVCDCRKPKPGLLLKAGKDLNINLSGSFMIGDNLSDIQAGRDCGCKTILLGKEKCILCGLMENQQAKPDFVVANLLEAAEKIEKETSQNN